ncbi:MAG TPA: sugar transferase [Pyrinomonadaceae bacterium]|jgi:exopolysaccharide biosynthesis polyprenyl glycosylphosphotransferase|nr:sugar transferase [Pyrinomonadaceae bacterium]
MKDAVMKVEMSRQNNIDLVRAENRMPRWVLPLVRLSIFALDAGLAVVCFVAAFLLRAEGPIFAAANGGSWGISEEFAPYFAVMCFAVPIRVLMLLYQQVYRLSGAFTYTEEAIKIFKAVSVGSLLIVSAAFLFRGGFLYREFSYSRGIFLLDFVLALVVFTTFHLGLRYIQTLVRRRDINLIPALVVGQGEDAENCISELRERPDLGYRVVGVISDTAERKVAGVPVVGCLDDLPDVIDKLAIQEVVITDNTIPREKLFEAMMKLGRKQRVEFRVAPNLVNFLPHKTSVEQIGVLPMVTLFCEPLSDAERIVKRVSDIIIAAAVMVIFSPVWLIISLLVKLGSRGPVLFKQERVGMDGRIFLCYKFRTMYAGADENVHREAYEKNIAGDTLANAGSVDKPVFGKVKNDARVTGAGKFLRRTSLDELPQLLNVLIGDMSVVGPRPPISYEVEAYELWHRRRLDMKPGITGLWQVSGRNRLSFDEMVRIDIYYIENWSLWLDLKIILLTLPAVLRGDGAR